MTRRSTYFRILGNKTLSNNNFSQEDSDLNVLVVAVLLGPWSNFVHFAQSIISIVTIV